MSTILFTHPACIDHDPGSMHPENPSRLKAVLAALEADEFADLERREAPRVDIKDVERVHKPFYVEEILEKVPATGHVHLDPDTAMSPGSGEAIRRAAGAVCAAVDAVVGGEADNAFCAVRPPGHHAESQRAMGFCLFNNVAVAAARARAVHGLARVGIVDFDVHHGNGTENIFGREPSVFYASSHQSPCYPGTGAEYDHGIGNMVNVELYPGTGSDGFRQGWSSHILPALRKFAPDLLIISAGFDAHAYDPLAQLRLVEDDYTWVTGELKAVAADCCDGRLVSSLEGGYDLDALGASVTAHVRVLTGS